MRGRPLSWPNIESQSDRVNRRRGSSSLLWTFILTRIPCFRWVLESRGPSSDLEKLVQYLGVDFFLELMKEKIILYLFSLSESFILD